MSTESRSFESLADMLGFQLRRVSAILKTALEARLQPLDLLTSEATLLIAIGEKPGCSQSELCRELRTKPANMAPLVGRLAALGLLARAPRKGRTIGLHLTESGTARLQEVQRVLQSQEDQITRSLSAGERKLVMEVLGNIAREACAESAATALGDYRK